MDAKRRLHLIGRRWKNDREKPFLRRVAVEASRGLYSAPLSLRSSAPFHPLGTLIELVRATCYVPVEANLMNARLHESVNGKGLPFAVEPFFVAAT